MSRINLKQPTVYAYNLFILFHFLLFFFKILYFSTVCNLKSNLLSPWHSQAKLGCLYNLFWYQVRVARCIPFSSAEPVVSWSRGRETRGEPLVAYKLSRVALGTRMGASVSLLRATARGLEANVYWGESFVRAKVLAQARPRLRQHWNPTQPQSPPSSSKFSTA